jgi:histo-blood group ABO system transferase
MQKKIVLHLIATGKYERFLQGIIESARNHFLNQHQLKFVVYTDCDHILNSDDLDVITIRIEHEAWPGPTLKRFHFFSLAEEIIKSSDFSFYIDVDSKFIREVDFDDLGISQDFKGNIGTLHPGYYGQSGTPERRPLSTAFISPVKRNSYFCGGFFGGSSDQFFQLIIANRQNIDTDLSNGIVAIWHDESHLNRYFFDNPPLSVLGLGFSCPEESAFQEQIFMDPYIIFLDKEPELKNEKQRNNV